MIVLLQQIELLGSSYWGQPPLIIKKISKKTASIAQLVDPPVVLAGQWPAKTGG